MTRDNRDAEPVAAAPTELLASLPQEVAPVRVTIFTALRAGEALTPNEVAARSGLAVAEVQDHFATLEAIGIAQRDKAGRVVAADGLSTAPTRHQLVLDGVALHTWCAIDAIGIPAAFDADATATTTCPSCGTQLEVRFLHGEPERAQDLVAWAPAKACSNVREEFCPEANLFCSVEHLEAWRTSSGQPAGHVLTVPELIEQGRRVWGRLRGANGTGA